MSARLPYARIAVCNSIGEDESRGLVAWSVVEFVLEVIMNGLRGGNT